MRILMLLLLIVGFVGAGVGAAWFAQGIVALIEDSAEERVAQGFDAAGQDWPAVSADGLIVRISGTAPDQPARFRALDVAALAVGAERVVDETALADSSELRHPPSELSIHRSGAGTVVTGRVAAREGPRLIATLRSELRGADIVDLLEDTEADDPVGWATNVRAALRAAALIETGRLTVSASGLSVKAVFDTADAGARAEAGLRALLPPNATLALTAPPPPPQQAIFQAALRDGLVEVAACRVGTAANGERIWRAVRTVSEGSLRPECIVIATAPPNWADAVVTGLVALGTLPEGQLSLTDTTVTLTPGADVPAWQAEAARETLLKSLPEAFTLTGPEAEPVAELPRRATFSATLSRTGSVSLAGAAVDAEAGEVVEAFARAQFGPEGLSGRLNPTRGAPPTPWILEGLTILSLMDEGAVTVTPQQVTITGLSSQSDIRAVSRAMLDAVLPEETIRRLNVQFRAAPPTTPAPPDPAVCETEIRGILAEQQIVFAPSSAVIDSASSAQLDRIASVILGCGSARFEIGGYTDALGGEDINLAISTARAEAVLDALLARGVFLDRMEARGYGEADPIADNETEEGRAANRRIELRVIAGDRP